MFEDEVRIRWWNKQEIHEMVIDKKDLEIFQELLIKAGYSFEVEYYHEKEDHSCAK